MLYNSNCTVWVFALSSSNCCAYTLLSFSHSHSSTKPFFSFTQTLGGSLVFGRADFVYFSLYILTGPPFCSLCLTCSAQKITRQNRSGPLMPRRPPPTPLLLVPGPLPPRGESKFTMPSVPRPIYHPSTATAVVRRRVSCDPIEAGVMRGVKGGDLAAPSRTVSR